MLFTLFILAFSPFSYAEEKTDLCRKVLNAYCSSVSSFEDGTVKLKNGQEAQCDEGHHFDLSNGDEFIQQLNTVDISDILLQSYPFGETKVPEFNSNFDPGRFRNDTLLQATYGSDFDEVEKNLIPVKVGSFKIQFNKNNGAAAALEAALKEIQSNDAVWKKFTTERSFAGSFVRRFIAGTKRMSAHSYAVAVDFTPKDESKDTYWKWNAKCKPNSTCKKASEGDESNLMLVPPKKFDTMDWQVVKAFEHHGFVWGGKWNHYDTMHFEYRPEFLSRDMKCPALDMDEI